MYVGRIVAIGKTLSGNLTAMYRVSSRSFPNRQAKIIGDAIAIIPKPGFENDIFKNPYIAYNCLRLTKDYAVATNGSQTDPIADKLAAGMNMRDALISVLHALDYEKDSYNTPRIAAIVKSGSDSGYLGIVRHDALLVQEFSLAPGDVFYVCTYEHNAPDASFSDKGFGVNSAEEACSFILGKGVFAELERPITAACALENSQGGFDVAALDAPTE